MQWKMTVLTTRTGEQHAVLVCVIKQTNIAVKNYIASSSALVHRQRVSTTRHVQRDRFTQKGTIW